MTSIRVVLVQMNAHVGDIADNCARIIERVKEARGIGADVVAFPEMVVTGYPPEDLLLKPDFIEEAQKAVLGLEEASKGLTLVVGGPELDIDMFNAAFVLHDGKLAGVYRKRYLPNYGVFDENRYFMQSRENKVFVRDGVRIGINICEDIWYPGGPHEQQALEGGAEILLNISSSPYHVGKGTERERMLATRAADNVAFVAFCNLVGAQDELVFDGHSVVFNPRGELIARGAQFEEDLVVADIDVSYVLTRRLQDPRRRAVRAEDRRELHAISLPRAGAVPLLKKSLDPRPLPPPLEKISEITRALILGTRDYIRKNGFSRVVVGLSGGVDSSLVAAIAVEAIGPENVVGVSMPARYSSDHSLADAKLLSANLGIECLVIDIDDIFQAFLDMLGPVFDGRPEDQTEENLQARIRGTTLMALSNKFGWLVLTTGNKSETGVGYSTLYGDTAGGFAVIKDLPKAMVYEVCQHLNDEAGFERIPGNVLHKPPSAELRPNQRDTDSLPPYEILDAILHALVDEGLSEESIVERGHSRELVSAISAQVDRSEYKRRQSPPGVKIMPRAFGRDWRVPITNAYTGDSGSC